MVEKWLTVKEVAQKTALSEPLIRRLVGRGDLEAVRPTTRTIRISEGALSRFFERAQHTEQRGR